jgi:hypothetical protein
MHYARLSKRRPHDPARKKAPTGSGSLTTGGYRQVRAHGHPNATKAGQIREHRLVMSQVLGRALLPGENVHHRNGNRLDNRPENLELWVTTQPAGERPADLVRWAGILFASYNPRSAPFEEDLHAW